MFGACRGDLRVAQGMEVRYCDGVTKLPDRPRPDRPVPERLTSEQFEMVIRRAAELQARSADAGIDGVSDEEALRIGRELGLSGAHLGQALAEVRGGGVTERGLAAKLMGASRVGASRTVAGDAGAISRLLESYLFEREYLVVQRRLSDRTTFVRATGVLAAVARTTTGIFRKSPLLGVDRLEVSVRQLEPGFAFVGLVTDLGSERTGHLVGGTVVGGMFGGVGALALGIAVAPAAALVGLPIIAASLGAMRYAYRSTAAKIVVQMEALLDRLEHGELARPGPGMRLRPGP
jgi:hypothetical protein